MVIFQRKVWSPFGRSIDEVWTRTHARNRGLPRGDRLASPSASADFSIYINKAGGEECVLRATGK